MKKYFLYLLIICLCWACGETQTSTNNTHSTTNLTDSGKTSSTSTPSKSQLLDQEKFSLEYPQGWTVGQGKATGELAILSTEQTSATDQIKEKLSIKLERSSTTPFTLESIAQIAKEQLKKTQPDAKISDEESKESYFELEYTGNQNDQKMKWKQRIWVKGKEAFVLIYTAEYENFGKYEKEVNQIMDSFKIK